MAANFTLYGLPKGPLYNVDDQIEKTQDRATGLRIIEIDIAYKAWTGHGTDH